MFASVENYWLLGLILAAGLAMVVYGADFLVDGASAIARRLGISEFVIGLTIVGFGTSCPELVVSVNGALSGNSAIALGNVVGSNIFNTLLILGITAVLSPIAITKSNQRRDVPISIGATVLLVLAGMKHTLWGIGSSDVLSRLEGVAFLLVFALYLWSCFKFDTPEANDVKTETIPLFKAVLLALAGLAGLIVGGKIFVESAVELAHKAGISDKFIAITILAGGTSLPELATCVVAAHKKKGGLALGNILGSNVFNILLILGSSAVIYPVSFSAMSWVDLGVLLMSQLLLALVAFTGTKGRIDRWEGIVFLALEIGYFTFLLLNL